MAAGYDVCFIPLFTSVTVFATMSTAITTTASKTHAAASIMVSPNTQT